MASTMLQEAYLFHNGESSSFSAVFCLWAAGGVFERF